MTDSPIPPAMTKDEWAVKSCVRSYGPDDRIMEIEHVVQSGIGDFIAIRDRYVHEGVGLEVNARHAAAALCLYNQPFGFTREMVKALSTLLPQDADGYFEQLPDQRDVDLAWAAIEHIIALLPPED